MRTQIIDGQKIADTILEELKGRVAKLRKNNFAPQLVVFLAGRNPASELYVRVKQKRAAEVGVAVALKTFPDNVPEATLIRAIKSANAERATAGILVQLPLPKELDKQKVLDAVAPALDVDCLATANKEKLSQGKEVAFFPPAAAAVWRILASLPVDLKSAKILIVGSGDLIGKPLAAIFYREGLKFNLATRHTGDLRDLAGQADIIISGTGQAGLIRGDMIKAGAMVIDAGTTGVEHGGVTGDVDVASVRGRARFLSPVPGGVGPITVAVLLQNVVAAAENRLKQAG